MQHSVETGRQFGAQLSEATVERRFAVPEKALHWRGFSVARQAGFEPTTPCSQGRCATRLRYAPASCKLKLRELTITAPGAKAQAENKPRRSESPSAGLTLTFARALRQKASRRQTKNKLLRRRRCLERFHQWPNALILRFSRHPMGTLRP